MLLEILISIFRFIIINFFLEFIFFYTGKFILIFFPNIKVEKNIRKKVLNYKEFYKTTYQKENTKYIYLHMIEFIGLLFWIFTIGLLIIFI